jgi:hypothetical protein
MKTRLENQIAIVIGIKFATDPSYSKAAPLQADEEIHGLCQALIASEGRLDP